MRSHVLLLAIAVAAVATTAFAVESKTNRYNVLFIAIDDLRPELGCYGVEHAQSPNLDELAKSAVVFDRHYVQVATCGASRYALLTGRSPSNSGVTRSNSALYSGASAIKAELQDGAQSMPEMFRRSGYRTVCLGKISHTADGRVYAYNGKGDGRDEVPHAWDALPTPFGPWKRGWGIFFAYADGKHREDGNGHKDLMEFVAEGDEDLPDGMLAAAAIKELKSFKQGGQPFFLGLGFFKPHLPFVAPRGDWEAMKDVDIPPPSTAKPDSPYFHGSGEFYKYNAPFEKSRPLSAEAALTARRAYSACVRYADRQVGRVIKELDRLGLADNTVVVVWGDHGWHLGEQQIWGKHTPWERGTRSVLMIHVPGMSASGVKTAGLAETIDIYPTLVEVCQPQRQATHHLLDGVSLLPLLTGEQKSVRPAATSYWGDAISIRTANHRLVVGKRSKEGFKHEFLYDLRENLDSAENVAKDQPRIVSELKAFLPDPL